MYVKLSITLATELTMHRYGCKDEDMGRGAGVRGGRERRKQVKTITIFMAYVAGQ